MIQAIVNGRPVGPQATKIVTLIVGMKPGEVVTHDKLQNLIGEPKDSHRYRSVLHSAFRRLTRENNILMRSVRTVGYEVADAGGKLHESASQMHRASKAIKRSITAASIITDDEATEPQKKQRDHVLGSAQYIYELSRSTRKQIDLTIGGRVE